MSGRLKYLAIAVPAFVAYAFFDQWLQQRVGFYWATLVLVAVCAALMGLGYLRERRTGR